MEARMLAGGLAALAGFAAIYIVVLMSAAEARKRRASTTAQGSSHVVAGLVSWRLRNGFAPLMPLTDALMHRGRIADMAEGFVKLCARHGFDATPRAALSVFLATEAGLAAIAGVALQSPVAALACPLCLASLLVFALKHAEDKAEGEVRDAVPQALESMAACFGSGYTLLQTFSPVSQDVPGALGGVFARSAHVLEMGGSAEKALSCLREGAHASQLAFVAVALDVQHQSGGAMRQVLDAAADTVKGELALRRTLQVQTAQARLSARIVVCMPFVLIAAFSLASPDFLTPFFSSVTGYALLALAISMQAAGIMLVRRALVVEGVS